VNRPWLLRLWLAVLATACSLAALDAAPARATEVGLQVHLLWAGVSDAEVRARLDRAAEAGASLVRVDVGWASLERAGKGRWDAYELRRLDSVVREARGRGLRLILTLADSPCWASSAPPAVRRRCSGRWWERGVHRYPPARPADYGDALAFLARRYRTRIAAWEMWNEPNHPEYLRGPNAARRYAALVRAGYRKAKPAAPEAALVAGALSEADTRFTRRLYAAGIRGFFDAFSIHPYSSDASPLDPRGPGAARVSFIRGVPAIRRLMLRKGDDKPVWLTEFGWSTNRGGRRGDGVLESAQAAYVGQALAAVRSWPYVPVAVYYGLDDQSSDRRDREGNYGLLRHDGSPKAAFGAFRTAALRAGSARSAALRLSRPPR